MKKTIVLRIFSLALAFLMLAGIFGASSVSAATLPEVSRSEISIPKGKQALYECTIKYEVGNSFEVKLGDAEVFSISKDRMSLASSVVNGNFGAGEYALAIYINPAQKMVSVDVSLPDGGKVTRGSYELLGGSAVTVHSTSAEGVSGVAVSYIDVSENVYKLNNAEPTSSGSAVNIYNVMTSFSDPATTRYFAFTALSEFVGDADMAIKYRRHKGGSEWTVVDAIKVEEKSEIAKEDYFKAEITGLAPGVEYEYMIGKKGSADEENDWSCVYEFATATGEEKSFTFVAVGDSQAQTWRGDTTSNKGFKYMQAALDAAISEAISPAFILHTGDVVEFGADNKQWNYFFKALGDNAPYLPMFATMGNHDIRTSNDNNYFSLHVNYPDNGSDALEKAFISKVTSDYAKVIANDYEDTVYSYDYGGVHFVVLNSGSYHDTDDALFLKAQRKWLENDLKANADARWTVVITHASAYNRAGGSDDRTELTDLYDKYGVDLVIQGHSHIVARTYPIKNGKIVTKESPDLIKEGSGTVYVTIGSTTLNHDTLGAKTVELMRSIFATDNLQPSYTVVSVDEERIVMTIKQLNGLVLDRFVIGEEERTIVEPDTTDAAGESATGDIAPQAGGCSSLIGSAAASVAVVFTLGAAVVSRKKDEE